MNAEATILRSCKNTGIKKVTDTWAALQGYILLKYIRDA